MPDPAAKPDLMRALGRMVQGLSALFWGLPLALIVGVQTARTDWLAPFGPVPVTVTAALLYYGLRQLGHFQPHERLWIAVLDRAKLLAVVNLGLSPFIYWWHRMPQVPQYGLAVGILSLSALLFLFNLNLVVGQLGSMLPDATLRQECRVFTAMNRYVLLGAMAYLAFGQAVSHFDKPIPQQFFFLLVLLFGNLWLLGFLILLPVAMTMALLWKIKETILANVFNEGNGP